MLPLMLTACASVATGQAGESLAAQVSSMTVLAAGDIGRCGLDGAAKTGAVIRKSLEADPTAHVLALGDIAYPDGAASDFKTCFDPFWGSFKARIRPAPGNHEYVTRGAAPYYAYFGANAGPSGRGYYSFDLGAWHIVSLNSNCWEVSCAAGSAQEQWLRADLKASSKRCTLAYWHHPLFSSGEHGDNAMVRPLYAALLQAGAEIVLNGHDHHYERFAQQDAQGRASGDGIREFVVGTGGGGLYKIPNPKRNSQLRYNGGYGVLKLTLNDGGYRWQYLSESGKTFTDTGAGTCH